ncbi:MAG: hypothetical protein ACMUIP_08350 [bacterium]
MPSRKIMWTVCVLFFGISIFCLCRSSFNQILPWSWTAGEPLPGIDQIPLSNFPSTGIFPTAGVVTSSGYPVYSPPASIARGCPVGLVSGLPFDEEFGPGTSQHTRCLIFRQNIKTVIWIKDFEIVPGRPKVQPIFNIIDDYKITHGTNDFRIATVVNMEGSWLMLNRYAANPHPNAGINVYQELVEDLIARGVKFYL